jgi:hypothetical protein
MMIPFSFYTGEYFVRLYLYSLPILAYFGVQLLKRRSSTLVLVSLLILALPLYVIAHYGNYARENLSPSARAALHFLKDNTERGKVFINEPDYTMGYKSGYEFISYTKLDPGSLDFVTTDYGKFFANIIHAPPSGLPFYVKIDPVLQAEFSVIVRDPTYVPHMKRWLDRSGIFQLIYTSSDSGVGPAMYLSTP